MMIFEISWIEKQKISRRVIVRAKNEDDAINKILSGTDDIIFKETLDIYETWDQENITSRELT